MVFCTFKTLPWQAPWGYATWSAPTCGMEGSPFLLHTRPGNTNNAHLVLVWGATEPSSRVTQRKRIVFWQGSSKVWRPWESSRMRVVRGKVSRS